jgi:hypothetical protein
MNHLQERAVIRTLEGSVLLSWCERIGRLIWLAAERSRTVAAAECMLSSTRAHRGVTLLVAVAVHLMLMIVVRPAHAYWLIVPVGAGVAAAVLLMTRARQLPASRG